jgi:hypothetical protein
MILDVHRVNEDSCDYNFDYLVEVFEKARDPNEPVYIEVPERRNMILTSYIQFTPALHYEGLILRIVKAKRLDVLELLDQYEEGLVRWWNVLHEAFFYIKENEDKERIEKMAWKGILRRKQTDILITFFLHPGLFTYTYNRMSELDYHSNLYDMKMEFRKQTLDPCTNCISKEWMSHKEAREVFERIRGMYYRREDCLENRYIEYLRGEEEKECRVAVVSMFLPSCLQDVIRYVVKSYV